MNLLKVAVAALGIALCSPSKAQYPYSFDIDTTNYQLLHSSLAVRTAKAVPTIFALWEISSPTYNSRWYVEVRGCTDPIGEITIHNGTKLTGYSWSSDGLRAVDLIAVAHCTLKGPGLRK
jgi:hypothetical protein